MNLMRTYILCRCQVHIIVNRTFPRVQSGDSLHFLFGQCEIKNRKVLYHPFLAHCVGSASEGQPDRLSVHAFR